MCPLWDAIDTPCLIRGFIAQAIYLYDETKKGYLTKPTGAGLTTKTHAGSLLHFEHIRIFWYKPLLATQLHHNVLDIKLNSELWMNRCSQNEICNMNATIFLQYRVAVFQWRRALYQRVSEGIDIWSRGGIFPIFRPRSSSPQEDFNPIYSLGHQRISRPYLNPGSCFQISRSTQTVAA
jgi:hypothetical protein